MMAEYMKIRHGNGVGAAMPGQPKEDNMFKRFIAMAAILGATVMPLPAAAQGNCGVRDDIVKVLAEKYAENHHASGLQSAAAMVEIWASEETGTWTILVTR